MEIDLTTNQKLETLGQGVVFTGCLLLAILGACLQPGLMATGLCFMVALWGLVHSAVDKLKDNGGDTKLIVHLTQENARLRCERDAAQAREREALTGHPL